MLRTKEIKIDGKSAARALIHDTTRDIALDVRDQISERTFKGITAGDTSRVERSGKVLERIETVERIAEARPRVENTVTGSLVNVPAYLQGSPMAMRRKRRTLDKAPLNIVVDVCASHGICKATLERRGVAILALLRKLEAEGYPVTLYLAAGMHADGAKVTFHIARMDSQPLDLARACWQLCDDQMLRDAFFKQAHKQPGANGYGISWPWARGSRLSMKEWTRDHELHAVVWGKVLDCPANELLVVPPVFLDEARKFDSDEMAADWVNEQYAAITEKQGDL